MLIDIISWLILVCFALVLVETAIVLGFFLKDLLRTFRKHK